MHLVEYADPDADVPSPIDLRTEADARAWADASDRERPWREEVRLRFAELIRALPRGARVLELGAGPGFLAERILQQCPGIANYTMLDFSPPMLAMSRSRLARFPCAEFRLADFKSEGWCEALKAPYTVVISMQAIHELRHKRHVPRLYRQVRSVLSPSGYLMICDHAPKDDSLRWTSLYMTWQAQAEAMTAAGFTDVRLDQEIERLYLVVGSTPPDRPGGTL